MKAGAVLLCAVVLVLGVEILEAQERVLMAGWVQWISGSTMQVMTDGGTVAVDLRGADQSSYQALRTGDRIVVDGVIARDRSRVLARDIRRSPGIGGETEAP
jgi:hypothetical protein